MSDEIPLFPVTEWTVGPIPRFGAVTVRLGFITGPMQPLGDANPGRHYVLTAAQATELAEKILESVRQLGTSVEQAPRGQQH